ncbi:MAG: DNA alkylation repair protein [bacterium]
MARLIELNQELLKLADPVQAKNCLWFFKTGKGEYGEGDKFYGIKVPKLRKLASKFEALTLADLDALMRSEMHEERFIALVILTRKYERGDARTKSEIVRWYLKHASRINNWDLVDVSAPRIYGDWILTHGFSKQDKLIESKNLWRRRIAIVGTFMLIRDGRFDEPLRVAEKLLHDKHDLIHKAVGWMLREVGKRDKAVLEKFLHEYVKMMPRTMLRYAIEKFSAIEREKYLKA